jgi:hypothetical protein
MKKIQQLQQAYIAKPVTLDYISPSTINSFLGSKMRFVGRLLGFDRTDNINFQKGNTVERAVNMFFNGSDSVKGNPEAATQMSMEIFEREARGMEKYEETHSLLPKTCIKAINRYVDYNQPALIQQEVKGQINGIEFKGITDFMFDSFISDCKVTGRTPSSMSQSHKNAAWIYHKLTGKDVIYDYFIPLKGETKHVAFEYIPDDLTEELVMQSAESIRDIMSKLEKDPSFIILLSNLFLCDPEQSFGDCPEIEYYTK